MDADGDGKINYQEFMTAASDKASLVKEDYLKAAFKTFDKDNNGSISLEELKSGFGAEGSSGQDEKWLKML